MCEGTIFDLIVIVMGIVLIIDRKKGEFFGDSKLF